MREEKYVFIGYSNKSKNYRLLNPKTNQLVLSRDILFDELGNVEVEENYPSSSITFNFLQPTTSNESLEPMVTSNTNEDPKGMSPLLLLKILVIRIILQEIQDL